MCVPSITRLAVVTPLLTWAAVRRSSAAAGFQQANSLDKAECATLRT